MWANNNGQTFSSKADAFDWLNKVSIDVDIIKLYCDGDLRYEKSVFGIWDNYQICYVRGQLPVERY